MYFYKVQLNYTVQSKRQIAQHDPHKDFICGMLAITLLSACLSIFIHACIYQPLFKHSSAFCYQRSLDSCNGPIHAFNYTVTGRAIRDSVLRSIILQCQTSFTNFLSLSLISYSVFSWLHTTWVIK